MKVSELIERLSVLPPDALVVVHGYEDGFNDVEDIGQIKAWLNYRNNPLYGNHEEAQYWDHIDKLAIEKGCQQVDAVVIS